MSTRNIVPRADGEGNIGTSVKRWLSGFFKSLTVSGNVTFSATLGSNLVTNGTFDTDLTGWSGTNWSYSSGTALHTAGATNALTQAAATVIAGSTYKIVYQVLNRTVGNVTMSVGGISDTARSSNGTFTAYITATATTAIAFTPSDFDGAIDNVSLQLLTDATGDLAVDGNLIVRTGINSGYIPYLDFTDTLVSSPISTDGTNVGIGTMNPILPLDIVRTGIQISGNFYVILQISASVVTGEGIFLGYDSGGGNIGIIGASGNTTNLAFWTHSGAAWGERMRIDSVGNVGIGTTTPGEKLTISAGTNVRTIAAINSANSNRYVWDTGTDANNHGLENIYDSSQNLQVQIRASGSSYFNGGNVGVGSSPNAAAILDLTSTSKGFLPPRMTTAQRDAIVTPPAGLVIYNTTTGVLNFYNGTSWGAV